ncbi:MAG: LysM peptidoglycan-binding domain-containing protein [Deltaproteobacteria bacterium]|nr:LysM peptidoglycan-binding domain-containing protein [Deltaproteobacteria bacterium]
MGAHMRRFSLLLICVLAFAPAQVGAQINSSSQYSFPIPAGLESSIEFWKKIFTEYSLAQLIYFDPQDPSKIYEANDVGPDSRSNEYINGERARIAAANNVDIERVKAQRGVKERTAAGIKRSGRYIAQIQQIFRERGLPAELTYLPIVESSYDNSARSSVGALGIWQFMPATGRQYMRVNAAIDERRDPYDASRAAAAYLKQAYDFLGSWPLAITSYNYGPAGIARAVREVGSNNLVDLIQRYQHPYFGFAPKHFYAEFLAAVEIGSKYDQYFPGLKLEPAAPVQEIQLSANTSVASLIKTSGLSRDELLSWNPALSPAMSIAPAGYRVKLPQDRSSEPPVAVVQAQPTTRQPAVQTQVVHHRVKPGETIFQIARRYNASVQRILQANGLRQARFVRAGALLVIPQA